MIRRKLDDFIDRVDEAEDYEQAWNLIHSNEFDTLVELAYAYLDLREEK